MAQRDAQLAPDEDDEDLIPIYRRNNTMLDNIYWNHIDRSSEPPDLIGILENIMRKESSAKTSTSSTYSLNRILILITYNACGRGGETRFLNYRNFYMDHSLDVLVLKWKELKQETSTLWRLRLSNQPNILKDNPGRKQVEEAALDIQTIVMDTIRKEEGGRGGL